MFRWAGVDGKSFSLLTGLCSKNLQRTGDYLFRLETDYFTYTQTCSYNHLGNWLRLKHTVFNRLDVCLAKIKEFSL